MVSPECALRLVRAILDCDVSRQPGDKMTGLLQTPLLVAGNSSSGL